MKTLLITTSALGLIFALTTTSPTEAASEFATPTAVNPNQQGKIVPVRWWFGRHHRGHHWYHGGHWVVERHGPYPYPGWYW